MNLKGKSTTKKDNLNDLFKGPVLLSSSTKHFYSYFMKKREEARRFLTDVDLATMQIPTNLKWMEPLLDFFVFIEGGVFFCFCFFCYRPSPENLKWKLSRLFIFWS
jgi:hypothetical protein